MSLRWGKEPPYQLLRNSCFVHFRTNISANSVSAGCDLTALFPRFIVKHSLCLSCKEVLTCITEHKTRWVFMRHRRTCYVSLEPGVEQQPLYFLYVCIFGFPERDRGSYGELVSIFIFTFNLICPGH
jgi:hypothetical protein